jgi:CheY-like chemotaxis protein
VQAHQKGLELIADVAADVPPAIAGDAGRIGQVITNLVGNAIKFTAEGHVLMQVQCDEHLGDRVRLHFSVSDTGIGIHEDKQATIFEAFRQADGTMTRRFGGTGLGLTISSTLVHLMDGRIWVESELEHGSTFHWTATFPLTGVPPRSAEPDLVGLRVLVVDDNEVNRRIFCEQLIRRQLQPWVVDSGRAALDALAEAARRGEPFPLVLLDANMPEMDGFEVAAQMAAHPELGGAPIMMLSSSGTFGDSTRCRELGIRAYLTKPIKQSDLFDAINYTLRRSAPPPDGAVPARLRPAPLVRARVLLVEDNLVNQRVAAGLLTRRGHDVHIANNGIEALAALESSSFDIILMDIQMLEMGGVEATRIIREREASTAGHTRIVAMTAHAMKGDRERYLAAGMDGYLGKPIDQTALFAAVEQLRPPSAAAGVDAATTQGITADPVVTVEPVNPLVLVVVPHDPVGPAQPIDIDAMRRCFDDDELVGEVIELFLLDFPLRMAAIKTAIDTREAAAIRTTSHTLIGAASNVSATPIVERLRALEIIAGGQTVDAMVVDAAWVGLAVEGDRLAAALRAASVLPPGFER